MGLSGRIVYKLKSALLPREVRILRIHAQAFAPGVKNAPTAIWLLKHLAIVIFETAFRRCPPVILPDETRTLLERLRKRPVLALTGHLGNWEYIARFGTRDGFALSVIARPARIRVFQWLLEMARGDLNVVWRAGPTLKAAAEILKKGAWLGALIDQDINARGERVPGFGLRAHTPSSLVELAIKSDAAIVSAFLMREPDGKYRLFVEELNCEHGPFTVLEQFQRNMSEIVARYPNQWVWFHKRWRTTSRERISGSKYIPYLESLLPLGDPFIIVRPTNGRSALVQPKGILSSPES